MGEEYEVARKAANTANNALRSLNRATYKGTQIHEVTPVKFGGSPTNLSNKMVTPTELHYQYTTWWNKFLSPGQQPMSITIGNLPAFDQNPPASIDAIESFERVFGFNPPPDYLAFMKQSNGGEGPVGDGYLMLWPIDELQTHNDGYNISTFAPQLFLFGSSGGGEAYAFDLSQLPAIRIVSVPFVGIGMACARDCGRTFESFLQAIATER